MKYLLVGALAPVTFKLFVIRPISDIILDASVSYGRYVVFQMAEVAIHGKCSRRFCS